MSFTPPKPIWVTGGANTAITAVNADGFSGYAGLTGMTETADSGAYELEWGFKLVMILEGSVSQMLTNANAGYYSRGYIYNSVASGKWIINNSKVIPMRGAKRRVEIYWQSIDGYLAPPEWSLTREDLQPHIERHPLFSSLTQADFTLIRLAFLSATVDGQANSANQMNRTSNPPLASNLLSKMVGGQENYYLASSHYTYSYYYLPGGVPSLNSGGSVYSNPGGPAGYVIPAGESWLRYADEAQQSNYCPIGGIVKVTSTFVGAPNNFWDSDIY